MCNECTRTATASSGRQVSTETRSAKLLHIRATQPKRRAELYDGAVIDSFIKQIGACAVNADAQQQRVVRAEHRKRPEAQPCCTFAQHRRGAALTEKKKLTSTAIMK
jgi:hypothetical protein